VAKHVAKRFCRTSFSETGVEEATAACRATAATAETNFIDRVFQGVYIAPRPADTVT
jgi:hypothetical protein